MPVQEITLAEALCGTSFTIKHLDDRILKVTSEPGEVIKPDSWKCIQDEGMPEHGRPYEHGNMYIQFHVKFPESLNKQQVATLQQTLGNIPQALPASNGAANMEVDNVEEVSSDSKLKTHSIIYLNARLFLSLVIVLLPTDDQLSA